MAAADTFDQPMAKSFKLGWEIRERLYEKEETSIRLIKGD